ncbi:transcriptional repressor [Paraeggerthella hongkongensis]|uniref:Fur family transcriptional regulator n=1 Tax=Paraeggerthella TaxID=651554 RepID=UPI000DF8104D|nr:transcriptional repressor [Paraeggerthella hongkongensis]MCD2433890.1 transcriptional repressor [Paraeggerthella hominis]MDY3981795.1 transcriptional repressor [Paraeggerthella sp.]RDB55954.1 transcriptional repressor [Paraeggerthella hongkongensis]
MTPRTAYRTKQKALVAECMDRHADEFLTVDEVWGNLKSHGSAIGRTTVYRTLEAAVAQGAVVKVAGIKGTAARYRARSTDQDRQGQLSCIRCKAVLPLDCSMLQSFSHHVKERHGFEIDQRRTVLYGLCAACEARDRQESGSYAT